MDVTTTASGPAGAAVPAGSTSDDQPSMVAPGYDSDGDGVAGWRAALARLEPADDDGSRIDQIRILEDIKSGCAAAQARITAAFAASQRRANTPTDDGDADVMRERTVGPPGRAASSATAAAKAQRRAKAQRLAGRSAAAQIALARRESPQRGGRFVGLADALVGEMPSTLAALQAGVINEYRATIIVRETACLSAEQRSAVDAEIAGRLGGLGDSRVQALVRGIAYRMDPEAATRRAIRAATDRRVSLRPAPDAMGYLTGLMPIAAAVACFAALCRRVDAQPARDGDTRTRDQRIVDEYIACITGSAGRDAQAEGSPGARPTPNASDSTSGGSGPAKATDAPPERAGGDGTAHDGDDATASPSTEPLNDGDTSPVSGATAAHDDEAGLASGTRTSPDGRGATSERDVEPTEAVDNHPAPRGPRPESGTGDHPDASGSNNPTATVQSGTDSVEADSREDPVAAVRDAYRRAVLRDRERHQPEPGPEGAPDKLRDTAAEQSVRGEVSAEQSVRGEVSAEQSVRGEVSREQSVHDPAAVHGFPSGTGVVINLVITDRTLFGDGDDPALLPGSHPIPAPLARRMVGELPDSARMWIRRLYTRPGSGELVAADSKQRTFPLGMRHILFTRDQICRTPWCNAPARHADHIQPFAEGSATSLANGQALSEDCNYTRAAPGWSARHDPDQPGRIIVTTPTGHSYPSPCPDLIPGHARVRGHTRIPEAPGDAHQVGPLDRTG